jgi:hypothetical protein
MPCESVRNALDAEPTAIMRSDLVPGLVREEYEGLVGVDYDVGGKVFNVAFVPGIAEVLVGKRKLVSLSRVINPLRTLYRLDRHPVEEVGFIIFPNIGAAVTGYHDGDISQRAVHLFKPGTWDIRQARPVNLSAFG